MQRLFMLSWGPKWGDMYTIKLGIKYQIENQDKSKNDLCEFIAKKAELYNRWKRQGQLELFIKQFFRQGTLSNNRFLNSMYMGWERKRFTSE